MKLPENPVDCVFRLNDSDHRYHGREVECFDAGYYAHDEYENLGERLWLSLRLRYSPDRRASKRMTTMHELSNITLEGTLDCLEFLPDQTVVLKNSKKREIQEKQKWVVYSQRQALKNKMRTQLSKLGFKERNRRICVWRKKAGKSYKFLAQKYGLSHERIRQIVLRKRRKINQLGKKQPWSFNGRPLFFAEPRGQWIVATHEMVTVCR